MKLCVGAASRLVVEEAARLQVPQIVASRRQVNATGGYIGFNQRDLVQLVDELSGGATKVVRDHGGPLQGGTTDDGVDEFEQDVSAGFAALHVDVCMLPEPAQIDTLRALLLRFRDRGVALEIGGEHDAQEWLEVLIAAALPVVQPSVAVMDVGGYCWADRQSGNFKSPEALQPVIDWYHSLGLKTKAHNMDWQGRRARYVDILDYWNVAPEYGLAETDARLELLFPGDRREVLQLAYDSQAWRRWFNLTEGTWVDRARCALRYVIRTPAIASIFARYSSSENEERVRERIRSALLAV